MIARLGSAGDRCHLRRRQRTGPFKIIDFDFLTEEHAGRLTRLASLFEG